MTTRVAIVDDHPLVVRGLDFALSRAGDIEVVARGSTVHEAREILGRDDVDVLLLDVRLPDGNGLTMLGDEAIAPRCPVLVLSSFETRQYVAAAIRFGAQGFMLKTAPIDELLDAIRRVGEGGAAFSAEQLRDANSRLVQLTTRERDILRLVLGGRTNDEISAALGTSHKTVEAHLTRMYERFGVASRVELALRADRDGWLDIGPATGGPGGAR
jgi:DNA-binding NarL/FixJ family response regulator